MYRPDSAGKKVQKRSPSKHTWCMHGMIKLTANVGFVHSCTVQCTTMYWHFLHILYMCLSLVMLQKRRCSHVKEHDSQSLWTTNNGGYRPSIDWQLLELRHILQRPSSKNVPISYTQKNNACIDAMHAVEPIASSKYHKYNKSHKSNTVS